MPHSSLVYNNMFFFIYILDSCKTIRRLVGKKIPSVLFNFLLFFSAKAFSDQRRKVKPTRRHVASRNPVKVLQTHENVKAESDDEDDDDDYDDDDDSTKVLLLMSLFCLIYSRVFSTRCFLL